jgi:hypothetical protein
MMESCNAVSLVTKAGSNVMLKDLESVAQGLHNDLRAMRAFRGPVEDEIDRIFGESKG